MVKFKNRVLNSDIITTKCEVKSLKNSEEFKLENNIICPYFTGTSTKEYQLWLLSSYPFWTKAINEANYQKSCTLTSHANGKYHKFLISGKNPAFLELMDIFAQIRDICIEHKIKTLSVCDFQALMISQAAITRCFKDVSVTLTLVECTPGND